MSNKRQINDRKHALADTQRAVIEAAERRGYERAREELDRVMAELLAENERLAEANDLLKRDEALLRQALEALELRCGTNADERKELIPALRERLGVNT